MPKIGKRILKSSLAVFLCFVIYLLRDEQGIVFYSCIAGVLCVQQTTSNTIRVARNRVEGTLIGGFMGMLMLLFEKACIPHDLILIQYALISFMIIPIIYITVMLKKTTASYISCVVFMSITVSHAMDVNPFLFAFDRILDTLIGIFVALLINGVPLPFHRNKHTLFYIDLDALHHNAYETIKVNQMIEHGAKIGFLCKDTPGALLSKLQGMKQPCPIICFQGTLQYNVLTQSLTAIHTLDKVIATKLSSFVQSLPYTCLTYTLQYNMAHIYFSNMISEAGKQYIERHRKQPYDHYICAQVPSHVDVFSIMIYLPQSEVEQVQNLIRQQFKNINCIQKQDTNDMTQLYIVPNVDVVEEIQTIAKCFDAKDICIFQQDKLQTSVSQNVTYISCDNIVKQLRKHFYSFSK